MSRATYRFREYTLQPDEAGPIMFEMQCTACKESGPTAEQCEAGTAWAAQHVKANPDHLDYREHITRPYRFEPGEWR
jgi:hypothetical protein